MFVGTLQVELYLPGTFSLKEKRFLVQSLKTKIRNGLNVSVAEVDFLDKWQKCCLGIACVSNERSHIDSILSKVLNVILRENRVEVMDQLIEIY